ncbi:helix-turn-helix domain-containing protein [Isachenkonia alkalipeptolytica]|uniref:Helix-turn-helix transcriptional regulator n=1 Tax=Isachenkonia alkalipeptolytica TaxID=2565777 RepID=A0AA44BDN1_9CLOT|nr:helix-turn-helix transcriptional regulator [Isachenkonia alkalipeptolytica]NBG87285.1 helix-turn-helix transcriptional regulator [Isachenkonia alkalipeptolytica]
MDFNLSSFGIKLKDIRLKFDLSQNEVYDKTGINPSTLRRLEGGKVIPKFETLEILSSLYREDLLLLFSQFRIDHTLMFNEVYNRLELKFDKDEIDSLEKEILELDVLLKNSSQSYFKVQIHQLLHLSKAVILYKKEADPSKALDELVRGLQQTIPSFSVETFSDFVYSALEIRILMNMAFVLNQLDNPRAYIEILEFCHESSEENDVLYPKICLNLSTVYIRSKENLKALEIVNKGIASCQNNRNYQGLNLLYYNKGIIQFRLDHKGYLSSIELARTLSEAYGHPKLSGKMLDNCRKIFEMPI